MVHGQVAVIQMIEIKLNPKAYKIYQILMWTALIFICLNLSLSIVPVYYRPYQTVNNPVIEAKLTQLKRISNFKEPIEVRKYWTSLNDNFNLWAFRDDEGKAIIYIDNRFSTNRSEEAMASVLAHELGHLALGHCLAGFNVRTDMSELDTEIQADAFAVRLVGKEAVLKGFTELMGSWNFAVRNPQQRLKDADIYNQRINPR